MSSNLLEQKNLGFTTVNWLQAVGISNFEQLAEVGAVAAYARIRQRGIKVSKVALYALYGALNDCHWSDLSDELKQSLLEQVEMIELDCA